MNRLALLCSFCLACLSVGCVTRVNDYVLEAGTEHGWVAIEHGNSACPALARDGFIVRTVVPRSRVACTSDPLPEGWTYERYYLANPDGSRTRLKIADLILRPGNFTVEQFGSPCHFSGVNFFFGTTAELRAAGTPDPSRGHPGCREQSEVPREPSNNPIKLSVLPVTHLASARCAPVRPAAYRVRYAVLGGP